MWTVIYIASNRERAESVMNMLMGEGCWPTSPAGIVTKWKWELRRNPGA